MAENLTPKKYIDSNNMKQILATVKNEIPIKVSELTNDSEYQTEEQVNSTVTTEIAKAVALGDKNFSTAPIGTVLSFAGQTAPHGYLLANGASYKVTDYPDLYAVIGNTYGGDSTNFNVPDYRETVLVGVGENTTDTIASHDVYELGEFKDDHLQGHEHNTYKNYESNATGGAGGDTSYGGVIQTPGIVSDGTNGEPRKGTTTHGKQKGVTYIIKAFHTNEGVDSGVSDDVINYVNNLNSYSTEETLTGGTWIDGKPIYRKVITHTLSNALVGLVEIAHNIQNIKTPIRIVFGKASVPSSPSSSITIPSQYDSTTFIQLGTFSDTYVQLFAGSTNWTSMKEITLCLEYTKTTDA